MRLGGAWCSTTITESRPQPKLPAFLGAGIAPIGSATKGTYYCVATWQYTPPLSSSVIRITFPPKGHVRTPCKIRLLLRAWRLGTSSKWPPPIHREILTLSFVGDRSWHPRPAC
ncbi:hypothetical protein RSAG8_05146, partial [Rhizoctonia solani AG-8 WAC10335]